MYWINRTNREIIIVNRETGEQESLPPIGNPAFVKVLTKDLGDGPCGVPLYLATYGDLEIKLPCVYDTCYIVSRIVAAAYPRYDFFFVSDVDNQKSTAHRIYANSLTRSVDRKEWEDVSRH